MLLTSLKRIKKTLGITNSEHDIKLSQLISTVSKRIAHFCKRNFKKTSYTEYFNPIPGQRTFRPKAYPIESITSLHTDSNGSYSGSEIEILTSNATISDDGRTFILNSFPNSNQSFSDWSLAYPKSLRAIFTGGLADHAVNEEITVSGGSGSITVSTLTSAVGEDSGAVAFVKSDDTISMVLENLYGEFEPGETIQIGSASRVIVSKDNTILANDFTDLVMACELQVRFMWKHYDDLENNSVQKDGQSGISNSTDRGADYTFLPEVRDLLQRFRNRILEDFSA